MQIKDIILCVLVFAVGFLLERYLKKPKKTVIEASSEQTPEVVDDVKLEKVPYIRKNLMTKNEWSFYKQLKPIADSMNLSVLCKTRVADLIDIEKGLNKSEWQTAFNRINRKHIDFILCKPENLYPILLIELDDNSHDSDKGKERDEFVEKILQKAGYNLLRTRGTGDLEERIKSSI